MVRSYEERKKENRRGICVCWDKRPGNSVSSKGRFLNLSFNTRERENPNHFRLLFSEAENHNDGMLSRSETEPIIKLELNNARLPAWTVTSPNNVSMTHEGNPGAGVDQFSDSLFGHQDRFGRRPQFWRIR